MMMNEITLNTLQPVLDSFANAAKKSRMAKKMKTRAARYDLYLSRLLVIASQGNLLSAYARFCTVLDVEPTINDHELITACSHDDACLVFRWLQEQPRIFLGLMIAEDETPEQTNERRQLALQAYIPSRGAFKNIRKRPRFDINIRAYVLQALSHGDDVKAGNNTLFRRGDVGGGIRLPFYSANAIGHGLREVLIEHWLKTMGFKLSKSNPQYAVWFHHFLYNGGIMAEGAVPKEFASRVSGASAGGVRSTGVRELRDMFPWFSLLGGVAKFPIEGRISIYDLRPECIEWGNGETPVHELFDWRFFVRLDQYEGRISKADAKEQQSNEGNISLPVNTEVLKEGTYLEGGLLLDDHTQDVERSALMLALKLLQEKGQFGGKKHRGHGLLDIEYTNKEGTPLALNSSLYEAYLLEKKHEMLSYLEEIGANPRIGG